MKLKVHGWLVGCVPVYLYEPHSGHASTLCLKSGSEEWYLGVVGGGGDDDGVWLAPLSLSPVTAWQQVKPTGNRSVVVVAQ